MSTGDPNKKPVGGSVRFLKNFTGVGARMGCKSSGVLEQLADRKFPAPEVCGSNPVIGNFFDC